MACWTSCPGHWLPQRRPAAAEPVAEFQLIREHFLRVGHERSDVALGIGDDCALLRVPEGCELAVSIDTLVEGIHFRRGCDPEGLGHKALAVNLSDLAAMGAEPAWVTLALSLPREDDDWLRSFSRGFAALAGQYGVSLVGGDTTGGPLSITVQVHGFVPHGTAVRRSGARVGDLICVTGSIGDAGLALRGMLNGDSVDAALAARLDRPTPRIPAGLTLRGVAHAMIDISDGLAADLGHILDASGVGADIELARLPLSDLVAAAVDGTDDWDLPLTAGDDYELCFTLPISRLGELVSLTHHCECALTLIGSISPSAGLRCQHPDGTYWRIGRSGYEHFAADTSRGQD